VLRPKEPQRSCTLAIKITEEEKQQIFDYAEKNCVVISALVRKLLFEEINSKK